MAQTGVESPLQQGETNGLENEKYSWHVSVSPYQFMAENLDVTIIPAVLFKVKVTVNWEDSARADGRQVELITLKLANKTL
jgi:general secretion pathway protein I